MGEVDFWANGWFPLHDEFLPNNWEDTIVMAGTVVKAGAVQGYLVSKEHVEKYNIKSLDDFRREEVKKAFDANGDGKADLVACPPGWGCEKTIGFHMDVYDLWDDINLIKAGYSASMADALARYNDGQPVFFYTWTPNWTVYKFKPGEDVMWINVPEIIPKEGQKGLEEAMIAKGLTGTVTDPCKMGFVANDIRVVANKKFLEENPAVKTMFSLMSVPFPDIASQNNKMFEGEDKQEDVERHVDEWIKNNQDKWNAWLAAAKAAAK
jgi:glycine betaine/proline transport system substrate-binding protein